MLRRKVLPYLFLAPAGVVLLVFWLYPVFFGGWMSFHDADNSYVGVQNYSDLLGPGGEFWHSLGVSVWYVVGTVPIALVLSFLIANLLFQKLKLLGFFRTIYFLPYVTSTVAAAMVWRWVFDPGSSGLANTIFAWLKLAPQRWTEESTGVFTLIAEGAGVALPEWAAGPSLALVCVMVFSIWHALGFDVVIFLAGLSAIPPEMHEAAEVDGAGVFQRMRHITIPLLSPTLFFLVIVSVIRSFQTFNQIYVLTPLQSHESTQNVTMLIYNSFRDQYNDGLAAATAMLLFVLVLGITLFQMKVLGPRVHY